MLSLITLPVKIIRLLESNTSTREIALGVVLALFLGFIPLNGPMALVLFIFFLFFKLNRVSTVLFFPIFKLIYMLGASYLIDRIGGYLLVDAVALTGFWAWITNLPVIAYLDLNNTLIAGGLFFSCLLSAPVYFVSKIFIGNIRNKYEKKIKDTKFVRITKKLNPFQGVIDTVDSIKKKLE